VQPGNQLHDIYAAHSDIRNGNQDELITAYAVHRPDGLWALMLINRAPRDYSVSVVFQDTSLGKASSFRGQVDLFQYSRAQYELNPDPKAPFPIKAEPPEHRAIENLRGERITLPAYSLTVVRGGLGPG
jgi:hypothetical protein